MEKVSKKSIVLIVLLSIFVAFCSVGLYFLSLPKEEKQSIAVDGPTNSGNWTDSGNYAQNYGGGSGSSTDPYLISTPEQFAYFAYRINSGSDIGGNFLVTTDLDMSAYYWTPIGTSSSRSFYGTFDGGGFEISGIYVGTESSPVEFAGLFGYVSNSSYRKTNISNVILNSSVIFGSTAGGIVGGNVLPSASGNILDIDWSDFFVTISNCISYAEIYANGAVGGIIGSGYSTQVEDCVNYGSITGRNNSGFGGGIVGALNGGNISKCSNYGNIDLHGSVYSDTGRRLDAGTGGICGFTIGIINECQNNGTINGYYAGGISGFGGTVNKCANFGQVNGDQSAGGISAANTQSMLLYMSITQSGSVIHSRLEAYIVSGNITNCFNAADVSALGQNSYDISAAGGIIGINGSVGAYTNTIDSSTYITPAVDYIYMANNYNIGNVSNADNYGCVGGIVGTVNHDDYGSSSFNEEYIVPLKLINNFNLGSVTNSGASGAIVGNINYGDIEISKNYWGGDATSSLAAVGADNTDSSSIDASYLDTIADLAKTQDWYTNESNWNSSEPWDFTSVWTIDPEQNGGYPIIIIEEATYWTDEGVRATAFAGGDGTEDKPYQISNGAELAYLSYMTDSGTHYENTYFIQTQNIDLSGHLWDPIDNFFGHYDGQNFEITNLATPAFVEGSIDEEDWMGGNSDSQHQGLFGLIDTSYASSIDAVTIENIILKDSTIYGSNYVGGIVAQVYYIMGTTMYPVTITNCISYADVYGFGGYVGGIAGYVNQTTVSNCKNYGNIYGSNATAVGGIYGYDRRSSQITNCENYGSITASFVIDSQGAYNGSFYAARGNVGGIAGLTSTYITNSNNYGDITVTSKTSVGSSISYIGLAVGGIAGYGYETISSCINEGNIVANVVGTNYSSNIGGLAGYTGGISNSYNIGNVSVNGGQGYIGGLAGSIDYNISITNCYNLGNVELTNGSTTSAVGGVFGNAVRLKNVSNSDLIVVAFVYNRGNILSTGYAGGLVGYYTPYSNKSLAVINCFNIGSVTSAENLVGAIIGGASSVSVLSIVNVIYGDGATQDLPDISSGEDLGGVYEPNITTLAKTQEWYLSDAWAGGWNFYSLWGFVEGENDGYPVFTSTIEGNWIDYRASSFGGGTGTEEDPYIISTPEHLAYLSYLVNNNLAEGDSMDMGGGMIMKMQFSGVYFKQTADIDLSAHVWNAIGNIDMVNQTYLIFSGNYDGGGYEITGMFTDGSDYIGGIFGMFIGLNDNITLKNINIAESYIQNYGAAGVVGMMMLVSPSVQINVENCHNSAVVIGTSIAGGIIAGGESAGGSIVGCSNTGNILGLSYAGGIIGQFSHSTSPLTIDNVYNEGSVTGSYAGGIVSDTDDTTLTNSHNTGNIFGISSNGYVGGLIGDSYETTLDNCYNTGSISGKAQYAGGLVAYLGGSSGISNSYNSGDINVDTSNSSTGVGGILGYYVFYSYDNPSGFNNCINYGNVTSNGNYTGGIAGYSAYGSNFENCVNYGDISGTQYVGGIAGDGVVDNSLNYGDISGTQYVGGISGRGMVNNSSNYGAVSGTSYVGGIAGYMNQSYASSSTSVSTILTLKNYGPVSATGNYSGGLIGQFVVSNSNTLPTITLSGCINLGSVTSSGDYVGGFVGHLNVSGSTESYPVTFTIEGSGIESAITYGGTNHGVLIGLSTIPVTLTNSYAISQIADLTLVGSADITMTNNLFILNDVKYYQGDDFSEFAWINSSSCPIPKALSTMSDYFTGTVTLDDLTSDGWTELTVA